MGGLTQAQVEGIVTRGLYLNHPDPISEDRIAEHFKVPVEDVHKALLRLRRSRHARDRQRHGERVWEPWR